MKSDSRALLIFLVVVAALVLVGVGLFVGLVNPKFGSPYLLLFLLLIPAAGALLVWFERRRQRRAAVWASPQLLVNMAPAPGVRRAIPRVLLLLAVSLLLVGFARPEAHVTTSKPGATIVLAVDVSGSMAATDVKPSRLGAADAILTEFVRTLPASYRVALVTFSSGAAVTVAPTYDHAQVIAELPHTVQLEGSAIGDGVVAAVTVAEHAFGTVTTGGKHSPAAVLVVSDGGQDSGRATPAQAATAARKAGIPVSALVLGTPAGAVTQKLTVQGSSQKVNETTQVPVETATMKQLAAASGGLYFQGPEVGALSQVYTSLASRLVSERSLREITVAVTAAALVLMLVAVGLSVLWFRRIV
jgi:Ca-activated chloride channel family protein